MCAPDEQYPSDTSWAPKTSDEAVDMMLAGLSWLARANAASVPASVQADCLRGLERAASMHVAARARVLAAFSAQRGFEDDGQGSARMWLTWQTRVTAGAARGTGRVDAAARRTIPPWPRRSPAGCCRCRGRGSSPTGPTRCRWRPARTRTRSCSPPPAEGADLAGLARAGGGDPPPGAPGRIEDGDDGFLRRGLSAGHHLRRRRAG